MTTTVTVTTHDWPARVSGFPCGDDRQPLEDGQYEEIAVVEPNSSRTFYPHRTQDILIQELASAAETEVAPTAEA